MSQLRDAHGQPPRSFYHNRAVDRTVHELLGLVKGVVCDGVVSEAEVLAFKNWVHANPDCLVTYPGNVLGPRVMQILDDGLIDDEERADLQELMEDTVGLPADDGLEVLNHSARLPLDTPPPTVLFDGRTFVFTGKFVYGPRARLERAVIERGGRCEDSLNKRAHYLVVGTVASNAWIQTTHGRKIERAMEMRSKGHPIGILGEEHWIEAIELDAS